MPDAPQQYKPPGAGSSGSNRLNSPSEGQYESGPNRYSHRRYRKFRQRKLAKQREIDVRRVHQIYQELEDRSFRDYIAFLESEYPLCVECLEDGQIKPGRVLDHITPIEKGGAVYKEENLQFLCDYHHNIKRSTEDKK